MIIMRKAKLFTHTDLDGLLSNVLMCRWVKFNSMGFSTERCSYNNVNRVIIDYLDSYDYRDTDLIIITDICPDIEVLDRLNELPNPKILIDHHKTAEEAVKEKGYKWAIVEETDSATALVYRFLKGKNEEFDVILSSYKAPVFLTDLWDSKPRDATYKKHEKGIEILLSMFDSYGFDDMKARFLDREGIELTSYEKGRIDSALRIKNSVCKGTKIYTLLKEDSGITIAYGMSFITRYRSQVADYLLKANTDMVFMFLIDLNSLTVSLRRNPLNPMSDSIDLSFIAEQFGGGGHPYASGFTYELGKYKEVIDSIIEGNFDLGGMLSEHSQGQSIHS